MSQILSSKAPSGPLGDKWKGHRFSSKLVNPANKRKLDVVVVGTGLAGSSAAASLAELGYNVHVFCFHDSARRAHSVAAQGGINAAKDYKNEGDSVYRPPSVVYLLSSISITLFLFWFVNNVHFEENL